MTFAKSDAPRSACAFPAALAVTALLAIAMPAGAATYYVDFDGGRDSADGLAPDRAWKHCPGDDAATGTPDATTLAPGDTVIFKGGVHYRSGPVNCQSSGAAGQPITFDGNTAGTFGSGRAIIDGAERLTGWQPCASQDDALGNPNWQHIHKAPLPSGINILIANMYENDQMLWAAQDPNLDDPFYPDDLETFRPIHSDNVTRTTLTDPDYFSQGDPNYWDGAYLRLWGNPNVVRTVPITAYDPATGTITFPYTGDNSLYSDRTVYYATMNHIDKLDVPGEYVVADGIFYLWPRTEGDLATKEISYSVRRRGFYIAGKDYITIQGFRIQKMTSDKSEYSNGCAIVDRFGGRGTVIQGNEMCYNYSFEKEGVIKMYGPGDDDPRDVLIDDNDIFENPHNAGMIVTLIDSVCSNNRMRKNGGTAIDFYGCKNSQLVGNRVWDNTGVHANGLTLYLYCENCFVGYNTVLDGLCALTIQDATNITVAYNVLHTAVDTYTAVDWGGGSRGSDGLFYYNNVIMNAYGKALQVGSATVNVVARNNVLDGSFAGSGDHVSHNIYTSLAWNQKAQYGWSLGEGESIVQDKALIFANPDARDFRLTAGSPAIDAGTDVGLLRDFLGAAVPHGDAPDIGAYEYGVLPPTGAVAQWLVVADHAGSSVASPVAEGDVEPRLQGLHTLRTSCHPELDPATVTPAAVTVTDVATGSDLSPAIQSVTLADSRTVAITFTTALPDGGRYTVALTDAIRDTGGAPLAGDLDITLATLRGDADGSGSVGAADVVAIRAAAGQPVDATTARYDLDGSGEIGGADQLRARELSGNALP